MNRPAAAIRGSGRTRHERPLAGLVILCAALGCAVEGRTASFKVREQISFDVISVSVRGWEPVGRTHAPLSSLRAAEGEKVIAVFVDWSGLEPFKEPDRQQFAEKFLGGRLKLVDSEGRGYRSVSAMPRGVYDFSNEPAPMPRDWVVVFHVRSDSEGYTLRLSHPDARGKSFDVAVVPLG